VDDGAELVSCDGSKVRTAPMCFPVELAQRRVSPQFLQLRVQPAADIVLLLRSAVRRERPFVDQREVHSSTLGGSVRRVFAAEPVGTAGVPD